MNANRPIPTTLFSLQGRVALITGASRGLGLSMATALAAHGATVWLNGRDAHGLQDAVQSVNQAGKEAAGSAHALAFDVTDEAAASAAVEQVLAQSGRLDILINNVGQRRRQPLEDLPAQALRELLESNLVSAWHLCREAARPLRQQRVLRLLRDLVEVTHKRVLERIRHRLRIAVSTAERLTQHLVEGLLHGEEGLAGGDEVIGAHGWRWPKRGSRRGF